VKKALKHFFFENKFGKWLYGSMAVLNSIEGIIHLVVAVVGTVGVYKAFGLSVITSMLLLNGWQEALTMWAIMVPNIENVIFGLFSLAVGFALGIAHHHHHHH
jgi:hypothetical protein